MLRLFSLISALILLAGCASTVHVPTYHDEPLTQTQNEAPQQLTIQYLGVGGHLMRYGNATLLTAPSFTNPHFLRVGPLMPISTDKARVDQYLPDVSDAQMILVGHAHYDHLMDVPYIMNTYAKQADVYGSRTMANSISPAVDSSRIHSLNDIMGNATTPGTWVYSKHRDIRIMALESSHAPHFMGMKFMQGQYEEPRENLPWHAFAWKEGQTLAYIIDFLTADGTSAYRVFYQDSASQEPKGLVPDLGDGKSIDIAILCPASFAQVDNYPESVMQNTQAHHFILGHWEDFFSNSLSGPQRFVRATSQDDFMNRFLPALPAGSTWTLPELFSTQHFGPGGVLLH
ncbi:hypothetical protein ACQUQU_06590 [Thalassolituus sp. LLYu03]|uniref:MBL fold metallo-hydrolase n=1 Tax=Thalassolituus sp. LLYu03 TaxID=3421656 RepID=UPI003D2868F0